MNKVQCPKCRSGNAYKEGPMMACMMCGKRFSVARTIYNTGTVSAIAPVIAAKEDENNYTKEREDMKNKLSDLNNHLFEQLERLNDINMKGNHLKEEISRAAAITDVAREIIGNGKLVLQAMIAVKEHGIKPNLLEIESK